MRPNRRRRVKRSPFTSAMGAALVAVLFSAGCGGVDEQSGQGAPRKVADEPEAPMIVGEGQTVVPSDTLEDWVSYGDALAVIVIAAEREDPRDAVTEKTGEGMVTRTLTIDVEEIGWQREGTSIPEEFTVGALGWGLKDGTLVPMKSSESPRLEVGGRYLVMLATLLGTLTPVPGAIAVVRDEKVVVPPEARTTAWSRQLDGATLPDAAATVARTEPDALAAQHFDLEPEDRYQAVLAARRPGG